MGRVFPKVTTAVTAKGKKQKALKQVDGGRVQKKKKTNSTLAEQAVATYQGISPARGKQNFDLVIPVHRVKRLIRQVHCPSTVRIKREAWPALAAAIERTTAGLLAKAVDNAREHRHAILQSMDIQAALESSPATQRFFRGMFAGRSSVVDSVILDLIKGTKHGDRLVQHYLGVKERRESQGADAEDENMDDMEAADSSSEEEEDEESSSEEEEKEAAAEEEEEEDDDEEEDDEEISGPSTKKKKPAQEDARVKKLKAKLKAQKAALKKAKKHDKS